MKIPFVIICLLFTMSLFSQVTFVIDSLPGNISESHQIYVAGDFQGWDPGHPEYILKKDSTGHRSITLDAMADGTTIQYKFTLGSWETVEKGKSGDDIENRIFTFGNGEIVHVSIGIWANALPESTASWNVSVVKEDFFIPQLDRYRTIRLYLPPGYDSTDLRYPVIYMHDGQNLFDRLNSYSGEWEVDETLNNLAALGYRVPIVIGIDNGGIHRVDELSPWGNPDYGGGQGNDYLDFIVETLKPYVDQHYKTLPDQNHTGIIGSSLGGNMSLYGALRHSEVFGKSGPFSPAYWFVGDSLMAYISKIRKVDNIKFYQFMGDQEGDMHSEFIFQVEDSLKNIGFSVISSKIIKDGKHDEDNWRVNFEEAYLWLFGAWANEMAENEFAGPVICDLSEDEKLLILTNIEIPKGGHCKIVNEQGKVIAKFKSKEAEKTVDIKDFEPGIYTFILQKGKSKYVGRFAKC